MKKDKIILWGLIVLCVITLVFIPAVSRARIEETDNERELLIQPKQKVSEKKKKIRTYCGGELRSIKVGGFVFNPPFAWGEKTEKGNGFETHGYSLDLFHKIAEKYAWNYESVGFPSEKEMFIAFNKGEFDILLSSYLPDDSLSGTVIYPSYFKNPIIVYVLENIDYEINSVDDLMGLRGVVRQDEGIYDALLNKSNLKGLDFEKVSSAKQAFTMLLNGEADYLIGSPYSVEAELRRFKLVEKIVPVPLVLMEGSLFFVLSNLSPCSELKKIISAELKKYNDQNTAVEDVRAAVRRWGDEFRYDPGLIPDENDE